MTGAASAPMARAVSDVPAPSGDARSAGPAGAHELAGGDAARLRRLLAPCDRVARFEACLLGALRADAGGVGFQLQAIELRQELARDLPLPVDHVLGIPRGVVDAVDLVEPVACGRLGIDVRATRRAERPLRRLLRVAHRPRVGGRLGGLELAPMLVVLAPRGHQPIHGFLARDARAFRDRAALVGELAGLGARARGRRGLGGRRPGACAGVVDGARSRIVGRAGRAGRHHREVLGAGRRSVGFGWGFRCGCDRLAGRILRLGGGAGQTSRRGVRRVGPSLRPREARRGGRR